MQPGYFCSYILYGCYGSVLTTMLGLANSSTGDKGAYSTRGDKLLNTI